MKPLIIPFFIPHAGCPHDCSYCNQRLIAASSSGLPGRDRISAAVSEWTARSPGRPVEVAFFGGSFTMLDLSLQRTLLEAVQPLLKSGVVGGIRLSTRPDGLGQDQLDFLAGYGVRTIEIGVQSLDDNVLKLAERGHTSAESIAAIARVAKAGFVTGAQLLPGLPGDSDNAALGSLAGVIAAGARFVRIYPAIVLKGTKLERLFADGSWSPLGLEHVVRLCARMLNMANHANIPVVRIGLQSDEGLVPGETVLAGPWHPAFGQLVRGDLYYALARKLSSVLEDKVSAIFCHPMRISDVAGHERRNLNRLASLGVKLDKVDVDPGLTRDEIMVVSINQKIKGSIIKDLNDKEICNA